MAPFRGAYIINNKVRPCCWYDRKAVDNRIETLADMKDVFYSTEFDKIRANKEMPDACRKCKFHEEAGGKSHRHMWSERYEDDDIPRLEDLDIYMGNLCNLACVSCSSQNSTKWIAEEIKVFGSAQNPKQDDVLTDITYDLAKDLKRIKVAGGEAMLMPSFRKFLEQLIEFDVAKNITLVNITNCTVSLDSWKELFSEFKEVQFILSIDAIGELSNYMRYHSNWDNLVENIKQYKDFGIKCEVNCTVSILNVYHLPDLLEWFDGKIFFRVLDYPERLSIENLKFQDRDTVIERLEKYDEFKHIVEILEKNVYKITDFKEWINKLDNNRNNSFWKLNEQFVDG